MVETRRGFSLAGAVLLLAAIFFLAAAPAIAQDEAQEQGVTVRIFADDNGERTQVAGVTVQVLDPGGAVVGEGVTADDGSVEIGVPAPGTYTVEIDAATLPEGVNFPDPEAASRSAQVQSGRYAPAIFQLVVGEGGGGTSSGNAGAITVRRVLQLTTEGLKIGLFLATAAVGLSLIFGTTGLVNFAHAEMVTWGALAVYFLNVLGLSGIFGFLAGTALGEPMNLFVSTLLAMVLGAGLGWLLNAGIFAPLRRRDTGLIAQMVVSIGIGIAIRYMFLYIAGGNRMLLRSFAGQVAVQVGPVAITPKDMMAMAVAIIALGGVGLTLQFTRVGRAMRAVSDNRDLAESSGIDVERVIKLVWVGGAALAALGGVLLGQADVIRWDLGATVLLLIFAGVTLGGMGTAYGALVGCIVVGLGISLSTLWVPSELRNVGALLLMVVVLLVRPQGILGRKERIG